MTQFIFIRHARSVQDKTIGPSQWGLNKQAEDEIRSTVASITDLQKLDYVYSSEELKAKLTAQGIVKALNKENQLEISIDKRLNEVNRDAGRYFETEEQFKQAVKDSFMHMDQPIHSWEPARTALNRFEQFMNEILIKNEFNNKTMVIVSHGTVLSLYFATIGNYISNPDLLYQKWEKTTFCSYGIMIDTKILRDLT